jgi:hypothetical protein
MNWRNYEGDGCLLGQLFHKWIIAIIVSWFSNIEDKFGHLFVWLVERSWLRLTSFHKGNSCSESNLTLDFVAAETIAVNHKNFRIHALRKACHCQKLLLVLQPQPPKPQVCLKTPVMTVSNFSPSPIVIPPPLKALAATPVLVPTPSKLCALALVPLQFDHNSIRINWI